MDETQEKLLIFEVKRSAEVADYLLSQIDDSAVARAVRERLDPRRGTFYTVLPESLRPERIRNWAWTEPELGYPLQPDLVLDSIIRRFLAEASHRVLGQNADISAGQVEPEYSENLLVYRQEVHWEFGAPYATGWRGEFPLGLRPFVLFFYRSTSPKRKTLDDKAIDQIVDELIGVAVMALDDDSYLIWWQTEREPFPGSDLAPTVPTSSE
jgi:hypothetical protein